MLCIHQQFGNRWLGIMAETIEECLGGPNFIGVTVRIDDGILIKNRCRNKFTKRIDNAAAAVCIIKLQIGAANQAFIFRLKILLPQ